METSRTLLRRFRASDLENLIRLESDSEIMRFTPSRVPLTAGQSEVRLRSLLEKETTYEPLGVWAAELKGSEDFVGWFMLLKTEFEFPELGFMVVRKHWGKGLATEVAERLRDHAVGVLGWGGLFAVTDEDNEASRRVLGKLGFRLLRASVKFDKVLAKEIPYHVYGFRGPAG